MSTTLLEKPEAAVVGYDFLFGGFVNDRSGGTLELIDLSLVGTVFVRAQIDDGETLDVVVDKDEDQVENKGAYTGTIPKTHITSPGTLYLQLVATVGGVEIPDPDLKSFPVHQGLPIPSP